MPSSAVCVDASFVVALVTAEAASRNALDLWAEWAMAEVQVIAPALLRYEVTAALRRKVVRGVMSSQDARRALEEALGLDIEYVDPEGLPLQAFALAESLGRPTTYDTHYLALSERKQCPLWTADERFHNAVHGHFPSICLLTG